MKAQVAVTKCASYTQEELNKSVNRALKLLGGVENFIKPNEKVLIKPNLLSARDPEEAVTTHPEFVRAVVKSIKPVTKNIEIGDSPGGFGKNIDEIHEKTGMRKIAEEEGVKLVKFDRSRKVGRFPVATPVLEADKIISVPKFKTHDVLAITAAVKNLYGIIPGIFKAEQHSLAPRGKDFAPILVDVFSIRKPDLTIVDAVVSMDREGPSGGRVRNTDFMIASRDAVAIDSALMKIVGLEPLDLYTNKEAHKRGLGITDLNEIEILGESLDEVKINDFEFSTIGILSRAPKSLLGLLKYVIRFKVAIDAKKCLHCKLCEENCPAGAIIINEDESKIDCSKCLLCMCCREICPHGAIVVNRSWLAKKLWG